MNSINTIPRLSLVTGYRNREIVRVRRFLDSLQAQTFRDFELIFVDYGSDADLSNQINTLCSEYTFCTYLFCDTRGKVWNRSHAINIGIQQARGDYFLSADVDLIYSPGILESLSGNLAHNMQFFCKAHLLPKKFRNYAQLPQLPLDFSVTTSNTLGLFHCVRMDHVRKINGYDEHYRIWGFEDTDLAKRLELLDLKTVWLDEKKQPIFHQWHPSGNRHIFMEWWWEDMTLYDILHKNTTPDHYRWGQLVSSAQRPLNRAKIITELHCKFKMNPFERRKYIIDILSLLQQNPGEAICVDLHMTSRGKQRNLNITPIIIGKLSGGLNKVLRITKSPHQLQVLSGQSSVRPMLYFFYQLIFKSDLLEDYSISESQDSYRFVLMSKCTS